MPKTDRVMDGQGSPLAIHFGGNVGYCIGGRPQVWVLPKHMANGYVGTALHDAMMDLWGVEKPDRILISDSLDEVEDRDTAALQVGLIMCVQVFACRRGIPVELVHPSNVHQMLFEKDDMSRRQVKTAVASLAKRRGVAVTDADAANALALFEYATRLRQAA